MNIGFIGTGNMGGAIARGYASSEASAGDHLLICNRRRERSEAVAECMRKAGTDVEVCESIEELAEKSDMVIIGVKPAGVGSVLKEIGDPGEKILISMAAGVSISSMEEALGENAGSAKLVRIMPNTPAQVGQAMTSVSRNSNVADDDMKKVRKVFDAIGMCEETEENLIDCVIGVSGSSPAYTYMYIQALAEAAENNGMEPAKARKFAAQAVLGAAEMVLENDESLEQLRVNVCSPGGTTIAAVERLFENGFMDDVKEGFQAAVERSKEMTGK